MSSLPKISIIVPVYNVEKYLRCCLDSIVAQTFTDWECICVDDGSPDNSGKILDEYAAKDNRFVIIHKENGGVSSARNAGLDIARGEYITFCDSDDWIESNTYETLILSINNRVDIISYDILYEYRNRSETCSPDFFSQNNLQNIRNILTGKIRGYVVCRLIKKEIVDSLRFDTSLELCEDLFFFLQLLSRSENIVHVNKPLYHYRLFNDMSATHALWFTEKKIQSLILLIDKITLFLEKSDMKCNCENELKIFIADKKSWYLQFADFKNCKKYLHLYDDVNILVRRIPINSILIKFVLYLFSYGFLYIPFSILYLRKKNQLLKYRVRKFLCK